MNLITITSAAGFPTLYLTTKVSCLPWGEDCQALSAVQNAAARLVTGVGLRDHITPVLRRLHWLPVRQRVVFKVAGLVHQSLDGVAPAYLIDDCRLLSDASRCPLWSSSSDI